MRQSSLSLEYVKVEVLAWKGGKAADPTHDDVEMAFPLSGIPPAAGDWKAASWDSGNGHYWAQCLVGPGGTVTLPIDTYDVWVKVVDDPELPIKRSGFLDVF